MASLGRHADDRGGPPSAEYLLALVRADNAAAEVVTAARRWLDDAYRGTPHEAELTAEIASAETRIAERAAKAATRRAEPRPVAPPPDPACAMPEALRRRRGGKSEDGIGAVIAGLRETPSYDAIRAAEVRLSDEYADHPRAGELRGAITAAEIALDRAAEREATTC